MQRLGSAANLNISLRCLVLGGVYRHDADGAPSFFEVDASADEQPHVPLQTVITRLIKMLTRQGMQTPWEWPIHRQH